MRNHLFNQVRILGHVPVRVWSAQDDGAYVIHPNGAMYWMLNAAIEALPLAGEAGAFPKHLPLEGKPKETGMKKLSAEGRFESGIDELLAGKVWAFTPVVCDFGIGLGAAVANERGYYPIPPHWALADTFNEMADHADELNAAMGVDREAGINIVCSSMREKAA